ncbi:MAG: ABC transporter ATP-binding protein [Acidimicrobiales bacterium]
MAWGAAPAGSPFMAPGGQAAATASGLPFAGVPEELQAQAARILASEPEHPEPVVEFSHVHADTERFTLRSFLSAHRWAMAGAFGLVVVETLAIQAGPLLTQIGIDHGVVDRNRGALIVAAIVYVVSVVLGTVASGLRVSFTGHLGERLMEQLRVRVFSHFQRLSLDFFTDERSGRLMTRMTSDLDALTVLFQDGLVSLAVQGLTLLVISVVLLVLNPLLALITVVFVVPAMLVMTLWFRGASDRSYGLVRDRIAETLSDLSENLAGVRVMTAHNRRRHNVIQHRNVVGLYRDANDQSAVVGGVYGSATEAVGLVGQALIILVGGKLVLDGRLSIGELTAFTLYLTSFFAPIQQLVQLYTTYQQGQAAVAKLRGLLDTAPSVVERHGATELPMIDGHIRLEGVTFAYGPAAQPVLHDVDLEIATGETFALVGPTGAGKSTIAKLITRFYDPTAGRVLIDGHDLRGVTIESLRRQLGVVPQEPFLFNDSVRTNLTFACPGASEADVEEAVRRVGLDELVARLPDGLDTTVHERGSSLSAGERQLLALGRAFLAQPRVLVLDEATSNLDLRSESRIERALDVLLEGRTAIVIAHRLATAMRADRIAVVDAGSIVELGTHAELVALGGRYAAMYDTWVSHGGTTNVE